MITPVFTAVLLAAATQPSDGAKSSDILAVTVGEPIDVRASVKTRLRRFTRAYLPEANR